MSRGVRLTGDVEPPGSDVSVAEFAVLGLLCRGSMHGYDIARQFAPMSDLGSVLPLEQSTVYALLKDLLRRGLVNGRQETVGRRPPRTVFSLRPAAQEQLLVWLQMPVERLREIRSTLLIKLYFCRDQPLPAVTALLDAQIHASNSYLHELLARERIAEPGSFAALVCGSKIGAARATLIWLRGERERAAGSLTGRTLARA